MLIFIDSGIHHGLWNSLDFSLESFRLLSKLFTDLSTNVGGLSVFASLDSFDKLNSLNAESFKY